MDQKVKACLEMIDRHIVLPGTIGQKPHMILTIDEVRLIKEALTQSTPKRRGRPPLKAARDAQATV